MPHDKNGRLIEVGDVVRTKAWGSEGQVEKLGIVTEVIPGNTKCNVYVMVPVPQMVGQNLLATADETELVAKADGTRPE